MSATDGAAPPPAGIYVHVPYCRHRCHFCAFAVTTHLETLPLFEEGLAMEIELRAPDWDLDYDSVYFGGGTPSAVPAGVIVEALGRVRDRFRMAAGAEVTLEANPGNYDRAALATLRDAGVNRLSIGVQTFFDEDLRFLTRDHSAADGERAIRDARAAGFTNLTADLLYGLPGRPRDRLAADLDRLVALAPDHVSAYQLTIEPGTPFAARARRGDLVPLGEDEGAELFAFVQDRFAAAGYVQYEVSSYARAPEYESRHNRKYWEGVPYLGLGPAAHSFRDPVRAKNLPRVQAWHAALAAGREPVTEREELDADARRLERLFLGLRTTRGLALADFPDLPDRHADLLAALVADGAAVLTPDRFRLTPAGLARADGIAVALR